MYLRSERVLHGSGLTLAGDVPSGSGLELAGGGATVLPGAGLRKKIAKTTAVAVHGLPTVGRELKIKINEKKSGKALVTDIVNKLSKKHGVTKTELHPHVVTLVDKLSSGSQEGGSFFDMILSPIKAVVGIGRSILGFGITDDVVLHLIDVMQEQFKLPKRSISKKILKQHVKQVLAHKESKKHLKNLLLIVVEAGLLKRGKTLDNHVELQKHLSEVVDKIFDNQVGSGLFSSLFSVAKKLLPKLIRPLGSALVKKGTEKLSQSEFGRANPELVGVASQLATKGVSKLHTRFN